MVKSHACHIFNPKYLLDYKELTVIDDSTLLLVMPNGKEIKTNINDVELFSTTEHVENAQDSFLDPIMTKHKNYSYNIINQP